MTRYIVLSDIEVGAGDVQDDFEDDDNFYKFVKGLPKDSKLVLNGDVMDFIKAAYKGKHTMHITPEVSLWKLERFVKAHPKFFKALQEFKNEIIYVIGNHDADVEFPEVQDILRKIVGNISFHHVFKDGDLHIEHGNRFDPVNYVNWKKAIVYRKGQQMLNIAPGSYAVMKYFVHLKRNFPKPEKIAPHEVALDLIPAAKQDFKRIGRQLAFTAFLVLPFTKMFDPTYETKWKTLFRCLIRYMFTIMSVNFESNIRKITKYNKSANVFVLGHSHKILDYEKNGKKIIETGTWRHEYLIENEYVILKPRSYAEVVVKNNKVKSAELKAFKVKRKKIPLNKFLK
jgi:UDP-2,3-diacylglucosamine pyrophosphatase LpxH